MQIHEFRATALPFLSLIRSPKSTKSQHDHLHYVPVTICGTTNRMRHREFLAPQENLRPIQNVGAVEEG
jgi:hypothetical protein